MEVDAALEGVDFLFENIKPLDSRDIIVLLLFLCKETKIRVPHYFKDIIPTCRTAQVFSEYLGCRNGLWRCYADVYFLMW